MKIENAELNEIPPPIEKILEFDVEDLHFRMMITNNVLVRFGDTFESNHYGDVHQIIGVVIHKPMGTQLKLESGQFLRNDILSKWEETREKFVRQAIANKHLLAKPINSVKLRV